MCKLTLNYQGKHTTPMGHNFSIIIVKKSGLNCKQKKAKTKNLKGKF